MKLKNDKEQNELHCLLMDIYLDYRVRKNSVNKIVAKLKAISILPNSYAILKEAELGNEPSVRMFFAHETTKLIGQDSKMENQKRAKLNEARDIAINIINEELNKGRNRMKNKLSSMSIRKVSAE